MAKRTLKVTLKAGQLQFKKIVVLNPNKNVMKVDNQTNMTLVWKVPSGVFQGGAVNAGIDPTESAEFTILTPSEPLIVNHSISPLRRARARKLKFLKRKKLSDPIIIIDTES